jgi:DNA topoisomerase VI subunit B
LPVPEPAHLPGLYALGGGGPTAGGFLRTAAMSAATLERTTFSTSRVLEFFTEKELQMQIGHAKHLWPIALVKELIDNALDACEDAGVQPKVEVGVEPDAVSVRDNGPGLPASTLARSLDFMLRVSDKSYYVAPTRGQLGNALKCVWAAPFVVDGERGEVEVVAGGDHHRIAVAVDRIAQEPRLSHTIEPAADVKTGTLVKMCWPGIASYLDHEGRADFYNVDTLLLNYALFNPHAEIHLRAGERSPTFAPTDTAWRKWLPKDPTSPHWYTVDRLRALIAAYLGTEGEGKARTVRELIAEFAGLSSTAKQKAVAEAAGLTGASLRDLVRGDDIDPDAVARLLTAMREAAKVIKPAALGVLGEAHMAGALVAHMHAEAESVRYKKVEGEEGGLPFVLEVAFGVYREQFAECGREVAVGLNWAPTLRPPIQRLLTLLGEKRIDRHDPVCVAFHLACPRLEFTDRGKTMLELFS